MFEFKNVEDENVKRKKRGQQKSNRTEKNQTKLYRFIAVFFHK